LGPASPRPGLTQGLVRVEPGTFPPVLKTLPGKDAAFEALQRRCAQAALGAGQ
jgi:hypothetical protein